jgi:hypothetical protein
LQALTEAEFNAAYPDPKQFNYDEFVWQDVPNKVTALARHDEAFEAWRDGQNAGKPDKESY